MAQPRCVCGAQTSDQSPSGEVVGNGSGGAKLAERVNDITGHLPSNRTREYGRGNQGSSLTWQGTLRIAWIPISW